MPKTERLNVQAGPAERHKTGCHSLDKPLSDRITQQLLKTAFSGTDCMWLLSAYLSCIRVLWRFYTCLSKYVCVFISCVLFVWAHRPARVRIKCALKSAAKCWGANMCEPGLFSTTLFWLNQVVFLHFFLLPANQISGLMGTYERHTAAHPWAAQTSRIRN